MKSGGGLTFAAVEGAGHMVPMDQPEAVSNPLAVQALCEVGTCSRLGLGSSGPFATQQTFPVISVHIVSLYSLFRTMWLFFYHY